MQVLSSVVVIFVCLSSLKMISPSSLFHSLEMIVAEISILVLCIDISMQYFFHQSIPMEKRVHIVTQIAAGINLECFKSYVLIFKYM